MLFSTSTSVNSPPALHSGVSLKRSGRHIWRKIQQLPDEGEDLPQNRSHGPARYITVVSLTSSRFKNIPPVWTKFERLGKAFMKCWPWIRFSFVHHILCKLWISRHVSCFCSAVDTNVLCSLPTTEQHMWKMLIIMTQLLHLEDNK